VLFVVSLSFVGGVGFKQQNIFCSLRVSVFSLLALCNESTNFFISQGVLCGSIVFFVKVKKQILLLVLFV